MPFTVGETIGAYRLVEQLGQGDMAMVFKAHHAALQRYVAIKALNPLLRDEAAFIDMFSREALVVAKLDHPNIVPIYDFAEHEGLPYLVMKYLECESLSTRLAEGPITLAECARILGAVGSALGYAHAQGVTHQDIKPSNILLEADGDVSLTDFGLARLKGLELSDTARNLIVGSTGYLSPEQASGVSEPDALSDQYSLGVVLFEMVTGHLPFRGNNAFAVIQMHLNAAPPRPSSLNSHLPPEMDAVILRALSKNPADRFPSVSAFVEAFQRPAAPPRPMTAPIPPVPAAAARSTKPPPRPITAPPLADQDGTAVLTREDIFGKDISLMLVLQPSGQLFFLSGKSEYWLGRSEPTKPFKPDLDLAEYRSMEQGVSRRHGILRFDNGELVYADMNSSNGSRINGEKLRPETPIPLQDGDELCLGRMVFRVYFTV